MVKLQIMHVSEESGLKQLLVPQYRWSLPKASTPQSVQASQCGQRIHWNGHLIFSLLTERKLRTSLDIWKTSFFSRGFLSVNQQRCIGVDLLAVSLSLSDQADCRL